MPGVPASETIAIDSPGKSRRQVASARSMFVVFVIADERFEMRKWLSSFRVCRVSSQAMRSTERSVSSARVA